MLQSRDTVLLVRAFATYVRPLLEVNSLVWSPHLLKDIQRLEAVQRRFTKMVGLHALTYTERLSYWRDWSRGELERIVQKAASRLFAYKLLFGLTALHSDDFFILLESTCTKGHPYSGASIP